MRKFIDIEGNEKKDTFIILKKLRKLQLTILCYKYIDTFRKQNVSDLHTQHLKKLSYS